MKSARNLATGVSALALSAMTPLGAACSHEIHYPCVAGVPCMDPNAPMRRVGPYEPPYAVNDSKSISGTWTDISGKLPFSNGPWVAEQLTDGTVIVEDFYTPYWYKLTPDAKGSYTDGAWTRIAAMPSGYKPLDFATEILPDGRMIMDGGESVAGQEVFTNRGALYDPVADKWTSVSPPKTWTSIGDAASTVLPDGSYMLADCCSNAQAIATISGTTVTWTATGGAKYYNAEKGWTPLPGGNLLTVDVWKIGSDYDDYEIYDTASGVWNLAGRTLDLLTTTVHREVGAAVLRPDGTIIQFSANPASGRNDLYATSSGTWRSGPAMRYKGSIYDCNDAPAALLPDGNVLVQANPGIFKMPSHFWEFRLTRKGVMKFAQVDDTREAPDTFAFESTMLDLPNGQVLWTNSQATPNEVAAYTPKGSAQSAWLPVVASVAGTLTVGSTGIAISGTNFNGFSLGGSYGDDAQMSTNFPLVRITNNGTGDVCFGRSYNFSTMGVWTQGTTNAVFDLPATCETGTSTLQVIVNGLASTGTTVTLQS